MYRLPVAVLFVFFIASSSAAGGMTLLLSSHLKSHAGEVNRAFTCRDDLDGGLAKVAACYDFLKKTNPSSLYLFDAGGFSRGSLLQILNKEGFPFLRLMGNAGYRGITPGRDELQLPAPLMARLFKGGSLSRSSLFLSSGMITIPGISPPSLQKAFETEKIQSYRVYRGGGISLAVVGIPTSVDRGELKKRGLFFTNITGMLKGIVKKIETEEKADIIALLSSAGRKTDRLLIDEVTGIGLVLACHETGAPAHEIYRGVHLFRPEPRGRRIWQVQLKKKNEKTGVTSFKNIDLKPFRPARRIRREHLRLRRVISDRLRDDYGVSLNVPLFKINFDFDKDEYGGSFHDLLHDAMRAAYRKRVSSMNLPAIDAVLTMGEVAEYPCPDSKGFIHAADIFRALPYSIDGGGYFPDSLAVFTLTRSEVKLLLELAAGMNTFIGREFTPYFSGLQVSCNRYRLPLDRVTSLEITARKGAATGDSAPLRILATKRTLQMLERLGSHPAGFFRIRPSDTVALKEEKGAGKDLFAMVTDFCSSFEKGKAVPVLPRRYRRARSWLSVEKDSSLKGLLGNPSLPRLRLSLFLVSVILIFLGLNSCLGCAFRKKRRTENNG